MEWAEGDWERLTDYVPLSVEEATVLLADIGRTSDLCLLRGGKANTNYVARLEDGRRVVFRIYERDEDALARERRLLVRVSDLVPVPSLLASKTTASGRPVGIFEFVEGRHPADVLDEETARPIGQALGECLSALTKVEYDAPGLFAADLSFERRFETIADSFVDLIAWSLREGRARKRLGPELRSTLSGCLDAAAARLEPLDDHYCLVHGDYKLSNILLRTVDHSSGEGWSVAGLLDWEFACAFTPLLDIAILMRHRQTSPPAFVTAFADAYGARAPLPDDWEELTRIIDLMNLVGFLNAGGERPRLYGHVRTLIAETLEWLG